MKRIRICIFAAKLMTAHESRQIRFRTTYRFYEQDPVQQLRSQVRWKSICKAFHLLEPTACNDVWPTE